MWPRTLRAGAATAVSAVVVLVLTGCTPSSSSTPAAAGPTSASAASSTPATTSSSTPASDQLTSTPAALPASAAGGPTGGEQGQTAVAVLATLPVKGRAPKTGYSREQFGDGWVDTDHNGCDTRNDVLARDLTGETFKPGTRDCVVASGTLPDPYSGTTIAFSRGQDTSNAVQIDHVVALSDAWQKGAQQWDSAKRVAFANDGVELLAVDGPLNGQKSDGDAATWLPPNKAYRCAYVARQVGLKVTWGLWVTAAERDAIAGVLASCPGELVPTGSAASAGSSGDAGAGASSGGAVSPSALAAPPASAPAPAPAPSAASAAPAPAPAQAAPGAGDGGTDPDMGTCKAAKAAGYGPYVEGQDPEYAFYKDADHDGQVCE